MDPKVHLHVDDEFDRNTCGGPADMQSSMCPRVTATFSLHATEKGTIKHFVHIINHYKLN